MADKMFVPHVSEEIAFANSHRILANFVWYGNVFENSFNHKKNDFDLKYSIFRTFFNKLQKKAIYRKGKKRTRTEAEQSADIVVTQNYAKEI